MTHAIAAIQGAPSSSMQPVFRALVRRLPSGMRIAGAIEEDHGLGERACSAGRLQSIVDGACYPIFQDLGPDSEACHLEGAGAVSAGEAIRRDIARGCDLVILSKFGKLEASGGGLAPAFAAAVEAGVPLLTAVSSTFLPGWERFVGSSAIALPPDMDAIEAWCRSALRTGRGFRQPHPAP